MSQNSLTASRGNGRQRSSAGTVADTDSAGPLGTFIPCVTLNQLCDELVPNVVEALRPIIEASSVDRLLNGDELAERLALSRSSVDRHAVAGKIPYILIGGSRRYRYADVLAALEGK